jgi:hypothetical protein
MVRIIRPRICHIVQDLLPAQAVSLRNGEEPNGTESSLGVDVETLAFTTTHTYGQLACHCKRVAYLGLSSAEFTKEFSDGASFNPTWPFEDIE